MVDAGYRVSGIGDISGLVLDMLPINTDPVGEVGHGVGNKTCIHHS